MICVQINHYNTIIIIINKQYCILEIFARFIFCELIMASKLIKNLMGLKINNIFLTWIVTAEEQQFIFNSCIRGHHVYKRIWAPVLGEELLCEPEFGT